MNRWNIRKIIVYSKDNRKREILFITGSVNIITGDSNTGKSAIVQIFDYIMGSQHCHIPEFVKKSSTWVGILWDNSDIEYFICRELPLPNANSSSNFFFLQGRNLQIPDSADNIKANANRKIALLKFESLLGIGEINTETFDSRTRPNVRISARHIMPYLLLRDDIIINGRRLFVGDNDQHRQHIIDSLPYFVGSMDENTYAKQEELKRLKKQYNSMTRQIQIEKDIVGSESSRAPALLNEAKQVGLFDGPIPDINDVKNYNFTESFEAISRYKSQDISVEDDSQLSIVIEQENTLVAQMRDINSKIHTIDSYMKLSIDFVSTANIQHQRLASLNLIPDHSVEDCPLCRQHLDTSTETIENVKSSLKKLDIDLETTGQERRKIDRRLQQLQEQKDKIDSQLKSLRKQKNALIKEADNVQQQIDIDQRRQRVIGRISLYLESQNPAEAAEIDLDSYKLIESKIRDLEDDVNTESRRNKLYDIGSIISRTATDIIADLPLDTHYRGCPVSFNPYDLSVGIVQNDIRIPMVNIGADENYLSMHISIFFAFHRFFTKHTRPVPGLLIIDQLTRPYYPDVQSEIEVETSPEIERPKKYFDFLFKEVERQDSLQIIILEHAYYKDDSRYVAATRERWIGGRGLIPTDWPHG